MRIPVLLAASLLVVPATANDDIVVANVHVAAEGPSGLKACEQAVRDGEVQAWAILVHDHVAAEDWNSVPAISPARLETLVRGTETSAEKRSNTKCLANMTYTFDGSRVRAFLGDAGIAMVGD